MWGDGAIETGPTLAENPLPGGEDMGSPARPAMARSVWVTPVETWVQVVPS